MAATKYMDMYRDFLAIVRKSRVGTVMPVEFTQLFNMAQEEVIASKLQGMDVNKKLGDDLLPLRKVSALLDVTLDIATSTRYRTGVSTLPTDCRRIARVVCLLAATSEAKVNLVKSNELSSIVDGVYSKPSMRNCYYHLERITTTDKVRLYVPNVTYPAGYPKCKIEYYISPAIVMVGEVTDNTKVSMFNKEVCTEIINVSARMYLESVQDARYATYNNELKQKN